MKRIITSTFKNVSFLILVSFIACDKNEIIEPELEVEEESITINGTGSFIYDSYDPLKNKPASIYYHVPNNSTLTSKILFVFHGADRDAQKSRDALIEHANQKGVVLIVPEFSNVNFPGGDGYNLGNVFVDGDNPSVSILNPEGEWAFSLIEPLFEFVKLQTGNTSNSYSIFGFSAGAQFAHRFLFFKPMASVDQIFAASAGWYTLPKTVVEFPYGIKESPILVSSLPTIFSKKLIVIIGESDNDPNASSLRRNSEADAQGTNRLARAQYFYNESGLIAASQNVTYNWKYYSIPNVAHSLELTADYAMTTLFN